MLASKPAPEPMESESIVEMARLGGLSDAVYAVALTLLVLDIKLPEGTLAGDVPAQILELAPKLLVYLIGFVIIGGAWGVHQRMLSQIKRGDGLLVWFNLFSLLFVTLVPACAALLGSFPDTFSAVVCFAVDVILIQLTAWLLWRHASKHKLINPLLDPRVVSGISRRFILSGFAFGLSIPLTLLNTNLVYVLWLGLFILLFTTDWLSWQQAIKTERAVIPLDGAARAHVGIVHGGGLLQIQASTNSEALIDGVFGGGLKTQINREDDSLAVKLELAEKSSFMSWRFPWAWSRANTLDWNIELNQGLPITLDVEIAGGQANLDLSELRITELKLNTGASSLDVTMPAHSPQTKANIEAGGSSLIIRVPQGVAALIHTEKSLASVEVDLNRFIMSSDAGEYRSSDYETAEQRADLDIHLAAGSVKVI